MSSFQPELSKCKITFLGMDKVGKSAWIKRYLYNQFSEEYQATIGVDFLSKILHKESAVLRFQIWDTSGQEKFAVLRTSYIENSQIIVLVFDVTRPETLVGLKSFIDESKVYGRSDTKFLLLANKTDLIEQRRVTEADGQKFAQEHNCTYIETSAKVGLNTKVFEQVIFDVPDRAQALTSHNLLAEIDAFQQKWSTNSSIQQISIVLKNGLTSKAPQSYFNEKVPDLRRYLRSLQWTSKSLLNSALNLIFTVFAKLGVYDASILESNQRARGDRYRFYAFGEKQAAEVVSEKTITTTRGFGCNAGQ